MSRAVKFSALFLALTLALPGVSLASFLIPQAPLNPSQIQQFVTPLPTFAAPSAAHPGFQLPTIPAADNALGKSRTIDIIETYVKALPDAFYSVLPATLTVAQGVTIAPKSGTLVYAYRDPLMTLYDNSWIGPTVLAPRGWRDNVVYINKIANSTLQKYLTIDQTLAWADLNVPQLGCNILISPGLAPLFPCNQPYTGGDVATAVHFHGTESPSAYDGGPDEWFTCNDNALLTGSCPGYFTKYGPAYNIGKNNFVYENQQEPGSFFYHDHGLGVTRLNVYGGMAGGYLILDNNTNVGGTTLGLYDPCSAATPPTTACPGALAATVPSLLNYPAVKLPRFPDRWIPLVIQDRLFDKNGQLLFPDVGINPEHPFWVPEFFGNVITVNGKSWPYLNVAQDQYRFTIVNGSNARFYRLFFQTPGRRVVATPPMWVIGTEQGYLNAPVPITSLVIAPGERYDVVVNFAGFAGNWILANDAKVPFPAGKNVNANFDGTIMQFRVAAATVPPPPLSSTPLAGLPNIRSTPFTDTKALAGAPGTVKRRLTLNEVLGKGGPLEMLLNNTKYSTQGVSSLITEQPKVGSTELWELVNLTVDAHPMHLHLVSFQVVSRQAINVAGYTATYNGAFGADTTRPLPAGCLPGLYCPGYGPPYPYNATFLGAIGGNPDITPFLLGAALTPAPEEYGWKDTVKANPGEVTRILVKFTNQEGGKYSFDATSEPGYVWHCHIVDHEDNEMMRPFKVVPAGP